MQVKYFLLLAIALVLIPTAAAQQTGTSTFSGSDATGNTTISFDLLEVSQVDVTINSTSAAISWIDDTIESGLVDPGTNSHPETFEMGGEYFNIVGAGDGTFDGYKWTGSTWSSNATIVSGLTDVGDDSSPAVFEMDGEYFLIAGEYDGVFNGWKWTGSTWSSNATIKSGLLDLGYGSAPTIFELDGDYYLVSGDNDGTFAGYKWGGSSWSVNAGIISGLVDPGSNSVPDVFWLDDDLYCIVGSTAGGYNGYVWSGSSWSADSDIIDGLTTVNARSTPDVFELSGDYYCIVGIDTGLFDGFKMSMPMEYDIYVTGDLYNGPVGEYSLIETLIPTADISQVQIVSNSGGYDYEVVIYWTEDTAYYDETISHGSALMDVTYTPAENITSGYINATYNLIDFSNWPSASIESITLDDVDVTANGGLDGNKVYLHVTNLNTSEHDINFEVVFFPGTTLTSPANATTLDYTFPPLLHDITFSWVDNGADRYKYQIATDAAFNLIYTEGITSSNTVTLPLEADVYYWRVYGYNLTQEMYSNPTDTWQLTVTATGTTYDSTAIDGVVYRVVDGINQEIDGVLVRAFNDTWSGQTITGENGYYVFENLNNATTYTIVASKSGYVDSTILVTPAYDETTTRNILMQTRSGAGDQYDYHYVKYTVKTIFGTVYSGVDVSVYEDGDVIALFTGETGTDGSITFQLDRNREYRLTFIDATQGINEELTHYPMDEKYNVYVTRTLIPEDEDTEGDIDIDISKSIIDDNQAYINVSYCDPSNKTTSLNFYIKKSTTSDFGNLTTIASYNAGATSNVSYSFIVNNYKGETYFVVVEADHSEFGDVDKTYSVRFEGQANDYGFDNIWIWLGIGCIMFAGLIPKATNATAFSFVICGVSWIIVLLGWFDNLGGAKSFIVAGLTMATVISIAANMAKRNKED